MSRGCRHASLFSVSLLLVLAPAPSAVAEEGLRLAARLPIGTMRRVQVQLEVGGHLLVENKEGSKQLPLSVSADLDYAERVLLLDAAPSLPRRAVRHYEQAAAVIKVDESGLTPRLPQARRIIVVEHTAEGPRFACPAEFLTREDYDLINVPANSLAIDRLIPDKTVAPGDTWDHDEATIAGLLGLSSVAACEVTSVLDRLEEGFAVIQLAGTVHGMVDGTATELEIRANYAFDIERTMVVRFHLALKEKRALGDVTPGVEAVAKLNMKITPLESSGQLTDEIAAAMAESKPLDEVSLLYENAQQGVRFRYGPKWYVTSERRDVLALRLIGDSAVVASCNISRLPAHAEGRETTLEQFQKDVRFALGDHFERFVSTRHWSTSAGLKCISVVARGLVNEIPIRWRYYLVFNETGQRLSLATTVHESLMDQLADADLELVETMQLGPGTRAAQRSASPETR